jgi:hypothetical protein
MANSVRKTEHGGGEMMMMMGYYAEFSDPSDN